MRYFILSFIFSGIMFSSYIRDNSTNTILSTQTLKMWQDDTTITSSTKMWIDAITYCDTLSLASFTDWRLPNINELSTLIDTTQFNPVFNNTFINTTSTNYWSSTSYARSGFTNQAWYIDFNDGSINSASKTNNYYVRCVRDFN